MNKALANENAIFMAILLQSFIMLGPVIFLLS